jgi:Zn-dependent alcohol dehydrogenase
VKLTRAQVGIAGVVGASSWTNAKFMAVGVDKDAVSRARGDGVKDVATPRLVAFVWACHSKGCCKWRRISGSFETLTGAKCDGLDAVVAPLTIQDCYLRLHLWRPRAS